MTQSAASAPVEVVLLGLAGVLVHGLRVRIGTRKALALVASLALDGESQRERLAHQPMAHQTPRPTQPKLKRRNQGSGPQATTLVDRSDHQAWEKRRSQPEKRVSRPSLTWLGDAQGRAVTLDFYLSPCAMTPAIARSRAGQSRIHCEALTAARTVLSEAEALSRKMMNDRAMARWGDAVLTQDQVPQHHLASYLGITPVSLSRLSSQLRGECSRRRRAIGWLYNPRSLLVVQWIEQVPPKR